MAAPKRRSKRYAQFKIIADDQAETESKIPD
jgi:hypothetical protein